MKKIIFLLYELLIFAPIFILATIITAVIVMIGCLFGKKTFWGYYPPHLWGKLACRLALCRIKVVRKSKLDPNQSYVFIPNHQGAFDIFLIYGYLNQNIKWVQKQELRKIPFVGKASEIAGHVFVDQSNLKSMKETITKAEAQLTKDSSMVIFPEGARTKTGKMGRFKRGAFLIAKEMNLPIVPVTVNGPYDLMKIKTYLINPCKLELIVHEPISTEDLTDDNMSEFINKCTEIVHSGLWDKYK
ncbi:1-acyl-sn-glycerol-3-phosphate acyltransferase [Dysgonomonas sp. BGC7]|uniref:lysophospholipid acyltransferase family protein n=1 Tax=Dysgonomonas sp. BGC7 TaxID=1658008 RepID=UPI000B306B6B|nr:lysophospholipid acyltransferase family protein [Dysgonomonas sp. BGC7]MBD8387566.1 1-acyl-sn-glycerol-3-phosphate acyltransferase [Dysgonomonas sp. BGC7]